MRVKNKSYVVELSPGLFVAPAAGFSGVTSKIGLARRFATRDEAKKSLTRSLKYLAYEDAVVRLIEED